MTYFTVFLRDELNDYFANSSVFPFEDPTESLNQILTAPPEGFKFKPVSEIDVILAVSHFRSQAREEDGIPQSVISKAVPVIAPYLARIFSASHTRGIFPSSWKKARIPALNKIPVPSSPSDFRPISLLSFLSKVLEKVAHDQT